MEKFKYYLKNIAGVMVINIIFTMIFGVDPITAWKDLIEGTIIDRYYTIFLIIFFAIFWFIVVLLQKRVDRKDEHYEN